MATTIDLEQLLLTAGVANLHQGPTEISGSCPMHYQRTGTYDTHPSWSINRETFLHHCFSCRYSGTLNSLLVDLTGAAPPDVEMEIKTQALVRWAEVREHPTEILEPVVPIITDWHLFNIFAAVPQRLLDFKHLQRRAIDRFEVRYDRDGRRWVLPLRSPAGELLGAQYRQRGSVLTLPEGVRKAMTLFGFSQMAEYDSVALVESPLDAVRLFGLGIPAIASLGAWISREQIRLMARYFSVVYMCLDNDRAGKQGAEQATAALRSQGAAVVQWSYKGLTDEDGHRAKDVGDVPSDDALRASWDRTRRWGL